MKTSKEIKDKIEALNASIEIQKKLRDTIQKGTKDYYSVDSMIQNFYRDIASLNWVLNGSD
jgi:hypothetical protein